ncbi:alpha/beta hydrolase [Rhodoblastus sphagnicola]|uniref:Alpha/beta hydrolase n=1 Tax=Rhodoblastus sphagnicola TaxID=333368 RepID=A0A2S6N5K0_9HYPH|nr:alpha/beta hydrolase [Rhodoblastus sphagnicola]MBB4197117.1 pimeloyl-ACP methyl ester carboxylesterase [Rhodoblastus sphagnicola]PPQ29900.1 alpha/beta hydrolase [Rhodoblastus sphagnicola]
MNEIAIEKSTVEGKTYPKLPNPLSGHRTDINGAAGRIAIYSAGGAEGVAPLLLIHSINATPSAYEVKPLFDHYAGKRPVYALDLPGFGQSDRSDRAYSVKLMTDAIHAAVEEIGRRHAGAVDALALSLSCEFLARAALERPASFRTLAFISPTGFEGVPRDDARGGNRGMPWLRAALNVPLWSHGLFNALTSRSSIKFFLKKTFGSQDFDQGMWDYAYLTTHQPGARYAPYAFVSGYLFSKDALLLYKRLTHPVWMAHGVRGDFVDYRHETQVQGRANWRFNVFPTGAFPHFERLDAVTSAYDGFLKPHDEAAGGN